ncbi:mechanosensitive ion channel [Candidatus Woesearchaeota archaeon]|nr:mechanosensitive ion channel [Candidatus Woesearchaeota archaeon]
MKEIKRLKSKIVEHGINTASQVKDALKYKGINRSILVFGIIFFIALGIAYAHKKGLITVPAAILTPVDIISAIVIYYFLAAVFLRLTIKRVIAAFEDNVDVEYKLLLSKMYSLFVYAIATVLTLWKLGVTIGNLAIFLGLMGSAIAFTIKDVLVSYLAWFILLTKRPFRIGDFIKIDDYEGRVQHIGTFHVIVDDSPESFDEFIRIPNKLFLEKPIHNYGKGKIPLSIKVPIEKGIADYDSFLSNLSISLKKSLKIEFSDTLDADKERIYVKVECNVEYRDRKTIRDTVIKTILKEYSKSKEN